MNTNYRIDLFYIEGTNNEGKKFKVPHTTSFGFEMTVQLNGGSRSRVQHDPERNCDFIVYDAKKCGVKVNSRGYLTLHITD